MPDRSTHEMTFYELGLEDDATKDEISETVDEWVMQNISWGYEIIDEG